MKITYWSDYACPYCYIGEARLKKVLASAPELRDVTAVYCSALTRARQTAAALCAFAHRAPTMRSATIDSTASPIYTSYMSAAGNNTL